MRLLLCSILLLAGCKDFLAKIPVPPTYDDNCVANDPTFEKLARMTKDMSGRGEIPTDPQEAYDKALGIVEAKGIKIVPKENRKSEFSNFTTTFPTAIFVAGDWDKFPIKTKAETMWHEVVHVNQWDRLGIEVFVINYAVTEGRWALEVPAYRESLRVWKTFGLPNKELIKMAQRRAEDLYEGYMLHSMPKKCMFEKTLDIWLSDL
jgi:hypothetical protein